MDAYCFCSVYILSLSEETWHRSCMPKVSRYCKSHTVSNNVPQTLFLSYIERELLGGRWHTPLAARKVCPKVCSQP